MSHGGLSAVNEGVLPWLDSSRQQPVTISGLQEARSEVSTVVNGV